MAPTDGWIVTGSLVVISWATWVTRRSFGTLSRAEHERICQSNQARITNKLDTILKRMDSAEGERRDMGESVAVLKDRSDRSEQRATQGSGAEVQLPPIPPPPTRGRRRA